MDNYNLKIGGKTVFFNFFRKLFTFKFFERLLVSLSIGKDCKSIIAKLIPPNYLYPPNSFRNVIRNGIKFELDLSDVVDHYLYFGLLENSLDKLYNLVKPGMRIVDVGANIGATSLKFSYLAGERGKVWSFEPDNRIFNKALVNIQMNNPSNLFIYNVGLGNFNANLKLYQVNKGNQGMNRILLDESSTHSYSYVKIIVFDDFSVQEGIQDVDLIKIDVEGFEMNVLLGLLGILKRCKPILFIELDNDNLMEKKFSAKELVCFLENLNYKIYIAENDRLISSEYEFESCHFDIIAK